MPAELLHHDIYWPNQLGGESAQAPFTAKDCPIVFLHGMGSNGRDWKFQIEHFRDQGPIVTIDLRGHGNSSGHDGEFSIPQFRDDVVLTLDHLGIQRAHLVGLSLGGAVAADVGLEYPGRVASLTLVNAPMELKPHSLKDFVMGLQRLSMALFCSRAYLAKIMGAKLFPKPEQESLRQSLAESFEELDRWAYIRTLFSLARLNLRDRLDQLKMPTLVVSGDRDYWPVAEKQADAKRIPKGCFVLIEDSGHATPADQPARFNDQLANFLRNFSSRAQMI